MAGLLALGLVSAVRGQPLPQGAEPVAEVVWHLIVDGEVRPWPLARPYPLDSLDVAARALLEHLRREGYYDAVLDSVRVEAERQPPEVRLYVRPGSRYVVGRVRLRGMTVFDSVAVRDAMVTRPGRPLDPDRLAADLDALLQRYEAAGYPLVAIRLAGLERLPGDSTRLDLLLQVEEGRTLVLGGVELPGARRTRASYVARLAGWRTGRPLQSYDPVTLRERLEETGFFEEVGTPELVVLPGDTVVVRLPVREAAPGSFDLVLGYLPAGGAGRSGSLVGSGHLVLRHLLGAGRTASLKLNRLPGQVSSVDVRVADPFLFGLPFTGEGAFQGLQQDSTYGKQQYRASVGYHFGGGLMLLATFSRENTAPGQAGLRLRAGRQRIPRSDAVFAGLGLRYRRLDQGVNPRRGFFVEVNLERGRKRRTATVLTAEGDTTREVTALRQERLQATIRLFVPTLRRQVLALGGEAAVLVSNAYDESDLFRFGGATSLRGYDEERFRGRFVARAFAEYRYQIDRASFAYVFFDLGFVETPEVVGLVPGHGFHPGYGVGLQFSTPVGLVNTSYAVNPEDGPTRGRIHAGLSFGL
ncbi:MAG: membrane protein [Rhodothermaceae bacterium]|nr:MAG: membrane protein [Rhodothermaceae bacterium]